jgi:predicted CXXCH cytochrome family protein
MVVRPGRFPLNRIKASIPCFSLIAALNITTPYAAAYDCRECHSGGKAAAEGLKDVYAESASSEFKHTGVEKECERCHLFRRLGFESPVDEISDKDTRHVFLLKGLSEDRTYRAELKFEDSSGRIYSSFAEFKPYNVALRTNDRTPPVITDAGVEGLKQAVFLSAVVSWQTAEPTVGRVEYGDGAAYDGRVEEREVFTGNHSLSIPLRGGRRLYRYRIIARDVFGNVAASQDFRLDASLKDKLAGGRNVRRTPSTAEERSRPVVRVFRTNPTGDVYIEVSGGYPFKASLVLKEGIVSDKHSWGLSSARHSALDACDGCHERGVSHPVDVRSESPQTAVPAEFLTIEGGVIVCATCHEPHGAERIYLLKFDHEEDLCGRCHKEGMPLN